MAVAKYKLFIGQKVVDVIKQACNRVELSPDSIGSLINVNVNKKDSTLQLQLPLKPIQHQHQDLKDEHLLKLVNLDVNPLVQHISSIRRNDDEQFVVFDLNNKHLVRDTLSDHEYFANLEKPIFGRKSKKVVIEFSSPNIAKPFHIGNFRSTIIGNYLSNLYEHMSYDVTRLTYLGDWGTQFGILQVGLEKLGIKDEEISRRPNEVLFEAYVNAHKASEKDPKVLSRAKEIFNLMERGENMDVLHKWKTIRQYTTEELKHTYDRIGISFDDYDWESNYPANRFTPVLRLLQEKDQLVTKDGKTAFKTENNETVTLLKSDGSSLYITRDILAAIERHKKYDFDQMLYVTDFSQQEHFIALRRILSAIDETWADRLRHVKFGRIRGMSTRKGEVVFLKDILDEAKHIMEKKQKASSTTKVDVCENSSDILGITAVIVNDLKQRRQKDYDFSWDSALQMKGDTGIKLQYTHCRLISLEENCYNIEKPEVCDPQLLQESEAVHLVQEIASNSINRAMKVLPVKNSSGSISSQRLMLFRSARIVLNRGMKILGLVPLDKM